MLPRWGKGDHGGKTARTASNTADQEAAEEKARVRRGRQVMMLRDADEIASFLRHAGAGETLSRALRGP